MIPKKYLPLFKALGRKAQENNINIFLVGGCVRDFYLGIGTQDIDMALTGNPKAVIDFCVEHYGAEKEVFGAFGTARVTLPGGLKLDFVRARKEFYPAPAALPVVTPGTVEEDLYRRDFTANAWAMNITPGAFGSYFDPYGAQHAIDNKYIAVLHDKSFVDDPTRLYRAARFAGRFGWAVQERTAQLMREAVAGNYPHTLSRERVRAELVKILQEARAQQIFNILEEYRLLDFIYPALKWHPQLDKIKTVEGKLAFLALSLQGQGGDFIDSLNLPRQTSRLLHTVWEVARTQLSPLKELGKFERDIIKLYLPSLPASALKACFLSGGELMRMGLSGAQISRLQLQLRRKQFSGAIKSRAGALKEVGSVSKN